MKELEIGNIGKKGCACGEVQGDGYAIQSHCHRTGLRHNCSYSGVHYDNEKGKEHAEQIAKYIEYVYMREVKLVKGLYINN